MTKRPPKDEQWPSHTAGVVVGVSPAQRLQIVQLLADGVSREEVTRRTGILFDSVMRVATAHGYPRRESMKLAASILERNLAEGRNDPVLPPAPTPTSVTPADTPLAAPPAPILRPRRPAYSFADLLAEGRSSPRVLTQRATERAFDAVRDLRERVERDRQAAAAAAEKSARPRDPHSRQPHTANLRTELGLPAAAVIRDWASSAGIACPARGFVPASVLRAYAAAHETAPEEASA